MQAGLFEKVIGQGNALADFISYELFEGNSLWRFGLILVVIIVSMALGRMGQFIILKMAEKRRKQGQDTTSSLFLRCLSKPVTVAFFAIGIYASKLCLVFEDPDAAEPVEGIKAVIGKGWVEVSQAVGAIAVAYAIYRFVDLVEFYLLKWTSKTATKLDDMLVPVVRKSLRVTIAIIATLWIADGILGAQVRTILLSAGVGGIAIALAAKDTIANFFGSVTIFADRPFQIDELVKIDGHLGPVVEVGFRSTRIRTLEGHLVTVPNSVIANSIVENVGRRPYIRRTSNITITYGSGPEKAAKAVEIIRDILSKVDEINSDSERPPRVYFNEFNDSSLNIYMSYWVRPPDYWVYQEVNQKVNIEMMKRFEAEGIEFAFPTQTIHLKREE
jgi:MscS family membrane protein